MCGDIGNELDSDVGVVARVALSNVMEESSHNQEVWPLDVGHERRGLGGSLEQVTVDGEAVIGVPLGAAAARLPLRDQCGHETNLVKCLDHRYRRSAEQQQVGERRPHLASPRRG